MSDVDWAEEINAIPEPVAAPVHWGPWWLSPSGTYAWRIGYSSGTHTDQAAS